MNWSELSFPEFQARQKQKEEEDQLLSLVVRWGLGSWSPPKSRRKNHYMQENDARRPDLGSQVYLETDSFVAFIPELKDRRVGPDSHVAIKDPQIRQLAETMARDKVYFKTLHWFLPAPSGQFDGIVSVIDRAPQLNDLSRWKQLLKPERVQLAHEKTVVVIFPAEHQLSMRRLCQEFALKGLGPTKLDDLYFNFVPAHRFLRQRFGKALSQVHFQFLAKWSYASFSLKRLNVPASTPEETKEPTTLPTPTAASVQSTRLQRSAPPASTDLPVDPSPVLPGVPTFLSGGFLQTNLSN